MKLQKIEEEYNLHKKEIFENKLIGVKIPLKKKDS